MTDRSNQDRTHTAGEPLSPGVAALFRERGANAVRAARVVTQTARSMTPLGLKLLFLIILGVGLAAAGAFGTGATLGRAARFAFWPAVLVSSFLLWSGYEAGARRLVPQSLPKVMIRPLLLAVFAPIGAAFTTSANLAVGAVGPDQWVVAWRSSVVSWAGVGLLIVWPLMSTAAALARHYYAEGNAAAYDFLMRRLPPELRGAELVALGAEDHYVRVLTTKGDHLLHMKFSDAVAALTGYDGVQTHRSWWVATHQVERLNPGGELVMQTGAIVPVSRRRKKTVRAALSRDG